ncbi:lysozyme [Microcoleus sp. Pol12B5]|uniref:lysozyme n=1 Tax=Microcoleus sp. Pol12B5 TaxID=3055396 RepID=UPI002FD272EE
MRCINEQGLALIKEFEGCQLEAYLCPAGVPTIGYGHTFAVEMGQTISEAEADALLRKDLKDAEESVDLLVAVPINDNQFSALTSFVFNVGSGAFERSTMLSMLNANAGADTVAAQFLRWNKANGEELSGLTRRRHAERALFLGKDWKLCLF